jgi:hypothetical protein
MRAEVSRKADPITELVQQAAFAEKAFNCRDAYQHRKQLWTKVTAETCKAWTIRFCRGIKNTTRWWLRCGSVGGAEEFAGPILPFQFLLVPGNPERLVLFSVLSICN